VTGGDVTIQLPDFTKAWEYENNFLLSCDITRLSKVVAHWDLFRMTSDLPGAIVECGVFKGASLSRFASFRALTGNPFGRKIIGFDMYGRFPATSFPADIAPRQRFVDAAGEESISVDQMRQVLEHKGVAQNVELVPGDITRTVPEYIARHQELRISLLNLDTDIYEPARVILEEMWPRIVPGGILILDDYGTFPGESRAVDEYFAGRRIEIKKFPYAMTPSYIVKGAMDRGD
jgi:hypothetical protein